jgi:glycosyltransferase involved in cell wall biosynthesis
MRVALANCHRQVVGGAESYIKAVVLELESAGHELALLTEVESAPDRERIELSAGAPAWSVSEIGEQAAVDAMRAWRPDLVYVHLVESPALEARLLDVAPAVLFAHAYHGMCISGEKTFKLPDVRPCARAFGWRCLPHFYPRRCGGLSPITMWRDYLKQSARHSLLPGYSAIVTISDHIRRAVVANGAKPERVHKLPPPINAALGESCNQPVANGPPSTWRIIFAGRMSRLKGVEVLLDAMPSVAAALNSQLDLILIGDGPDRAHLQEKAQRAQSRERRLNVRMPGWMNPQQLRAAFSEADLLVVPSLWPEPFGLIGPEAGRFGVPAAAFDVGGISEWLRDGVNGELAPGDPPTARGLADAIVRCLRDPVLYVKLRKGALETSLRFDMKRHVESLIGIFGQVAEPELRQGSELCRSSL